MARLAYSGYSSSAYDRPGPRYTTVTHQLSSLAIEILELLGKGTTTEDLVQRLSKSTDPDLSTLDSDLSLFSEHKLTGGDRDAREILTSIRGIIAAVRESRTPQGILTQKVLNKFSKGTSLAAVESLLEAETSETLGNLPSCLDRTAVGATAEGQRALDTVKELAEIIREERTLQGVLAKKILALLARSAPHSEMDDALNAAADETLRNLPKCLDRVIRNVPQSKDVLGKIKEKAGAIVESRTPYGILARKLLDTGGGGSEFLKLSRDTPSDILSVLVRYLERISPSLEPTKQAAVPEIKACVEQLVASRTPLGVLAGKVLQTIEECLVHLDRESRKDAATRLVSALQEASPETLRALPPYLARVSLKMSEVERTSKGSTIAWINDACAADLKRRELGKPVSALRLRPFPLRKVCVVWMKPAVVAAILGIVLLGYLVLK